MRRGGVEFGGKTRAVGAERVKLLCDRVAAGIGLALAGDRRLQRIQRLSEPAGGGIDRAWIGHVTQHSSSQKLVATQGVKAASLN